MAPYSPGYFTRPEIHVLKRRKKRIIWKNVVTSLFGLFLHILSISKEVQSTGGPESLEDLFSLGNLNCSGKKMSGYNFHCNRNTEILHVICRLLLTTFHLIC